MKKPFVIAMILLSTTTSFAALSKETAIAGLEQETDAYISNPAADKFISIVKRGDNLLSVLITKPETLKEQERVIALLSRTRSTVFSGTVCEAAAQSAIQSANASLTQANTFNLDAQRVIVAEKVVDIMQAVLNQGVIPNTDKRPQDHQACIQAHTQMFDYVRVMPRGIEEYIRLKK